MAVLTGTLTVNAAFLQEIKEDNRDLRQLLSSVADRCCRPTGPGPTARPLVDQLWKLRDQLALHFALEDAYGYFEDAILESPRLNGKAEKLHAEHDVFFLEICELVEAAEELLYCEQHAPSHISISVRFLEFHTRFERHEREENQLILSAFNDDIGVGD
ncbi:MAG TPA: hemerythrin domain-containing protein [Pirellulales bacterium]|nr:hemerythrin domain-containing protein [Pirellulales bacterium]